MIAKEKRTYSVCLEAVRERWSNFLHVPVVLRTREMSLLALEGSGYALYYVPEFVLNRESYISVCWKNPFCFRYVPYEHRDRELAAEIMKTNPELELYFTRLERMDYL